MRTKLKPQISKPSSPTNTKARERGKRRRHILSWTFISRRILIQIKLVVLLRIPPLPSRDDLSRKRLMIPLLGHLIRNNFGDLLLLLAVREDRAAVLGANIGTLHVLGRGVVHAEEEFQERSVADDRGVEGYLDGFGVYISQIPSLGHHRTRKG